MINLKWATETYSIVSCSTRDTSPRDLYIMTGQRVFKNNDRKVFIFDDTQVGLPSNFFSCNDQDGGMDYMAHNWRICEVFVSFCNGKVAEFFEIFCALLCLKDMKSKIGV